MIRKGVNDFGLTMVLGSIAANIASSLPKLVNKHTEVMSFEHSANKSSHMMTMLARLVEVDKTKVSKATLQSTIAPSLEMDANQLCSAPVSGTLIKEYNVTYRLQYHDVAMRYLYGYDITQVRCRAMQ